MKNLIKILTASAAVVVASTASAAIPGTYVDATSGASGNTAIAPSAGGGVWNPVAVDAVDNMWRARTALGLNASGVADASGTVFEASGNAGGEDSQRLVTTLTGLAANTYDVYVLFWGDQNSSPWRIRAGLTDTVNNLFVGGAAPAGTPLPVDTTVRDGSQRVLWSGYLGQVTGTTISAFIDDGPGADGNSRSWYDGVSYSPVPEPTSMALLGMGALVSTFVIRRRK